LPGRRSRVAVTLLTVVTACAVAGCGGSGPALVDSSTTRPVPTTIRLAKGWRAGGGGDHVEVATSRTCRRSAGGVDCPGFLLLGPTQIAIASELSPFDPARVWHPGAGVEGCPEDRDGLAEVTPSRPAKQATARVGGKDAAYREWRIGCVDARTGKPKAGYTQRVWYLKASGILVVDEWSTPGLGAVLAAGRFG
jgi:hypothetical protein